MTKNEKPPTLKPPQYLRAATRRWWLTTVTAWQLELHHVLMLTVAAEAWDRLQQARRTIYALQRSIVSTMNS
jgi:hypothetical protein